MSKALSVFVVSAAAAVFFTGCASNGLTGPEAKLGRGFVNVTEFTRMGEITRSMEQTALTHDPEVAYTGGFIHGVSRSVARTAVGAYEIVTFPIPNGKGKNYGPVYKPGGAVYPANYRPGIMSDSMFQPDAHLGFSGGEVAPFIPGSRFTIFDD